MSKKIAVGIDVGTYQVKVVVAQQQPNNTITMLGTGIAHSHGIRHGYVINPQDITRTLRSAVAQAEKASGVTIRHAYLSVGGVGLEEFRSRAEIIVSRADNEVTELDIKNVLEESERKIGQRLINRKVIHAIPLSYKLDGERLIGRPGGMRGTKLEVEALFITTLEQHLNDLITAVEDVNISVIDVMASPLAGSFVTLTKAQKMAGVALANIGSETISLVVFENNIPLSVKVFPVGSTSITHDIALGLKISLDDAEQAKCGTLIDASTNKKRLEDIITSRLSDMFRLVENHLKKIGKNGLLPAGIVLTGGGSGIATIEDIAKAVLSLPSRKASLLNTTHPAKVKDSTWAVAYGLCIWGLANDKQSRPISNIKEKIQNMISWFQQFLP